MKKLTFVLALVIVFAFAGSAFAAQALQGGSYLSTTPTGMTITGTAPAGSTISRTYSNNKFTADGISNYPYEIYLPNEQNPAEYRIHSNYAKNTDACASCHSTHTAVGASLLQWYSAYETCMACHDGTVTTTYDVASGTIGAAGNKAAMGGAFNGTGGSASNHNVTGAMSIAAAPGGSTVETSLSVGGALQKRWTPEFGCESCHTPHGMGGNARILNPDPNFAASQNKSATGYTIQAVTNIVYAGSKPVYMLTQYPYSASFKDAGGTAVTGPTINNAAGYSVVVNPGVATQVYGTAALTVKMNIANYLNGATVGGETVQHVSGMNAFCGACHTDYNTDGWSDASVGYTAPQTTNSAAYETGTYSKAHRHQVGNDASHFTAKLAGAKMPSESGKLECLTCHVAHGVSADFWIASLSTSTGEYAGITDPQVYVELAGSSALKRQPNMGVCETCHDKSTGNEGYAANSGAASTQGALVADAAMPSTYNFDARKADYAATDLGWVGNAKCLACHKDYVDGWAASKHATSSHTGATGCGRCHNPGDSLMTTGTFASGQADAGITCESCHGSGAKHILAPSAKNIFNPGTTSIERQAIECGRCHDAFSNTLADTRGNLSATSGLGLTSVAKLTTSAIDAKTGWSVAFRVYADNPANFTDASNTNPDGSTNYVSNHFGGAWGYADSKHFLGTGTAENPNGVVSCNTCHDMHSDKNAGLLKYQYSQICSSCHDASANLAFDVAMPTNSWTKHQIDGVDYAHSFKFGTPAKIASVTLTPWSGNKGQIIPSATLTRTGTGAAGSLYPRTNAKSEVAFKIQAYDSASAQVFNNYSGNWKITSSPAGLQAGDVVIEEGTGLVVIVYDTAAGSRLNGVYTVKYTSKADPTVTATTSFTVTN